MDDAVMEELRRRLTEADRLDVSRYQFINMERLQLAAGSSWPDMRNRVFLATRSMIERRIAEDDLIIPCATGFLVIYKALSGKLAEQTTSRIRADMERFFLGDKQLSGLGVKTFSEQLSLAEFEATLAAADLEFVDDDIEAPAPKPSPKPEPVSATGLKFFPVWDAQMEAAASYFVRPVSASDDGLLGSDLVRPDKADARLEFDLDVLERTAQALERLMSTGSRCAVIAPVGFAQASIARTRSSYVTALSRLPEALKPFIWLRLEDAPGNAPSSIMAETGRILLAQAKHLYTDIGLAAVSLESEAETGGGFVGARLLPTQAKAPRADLDRIVALARRRRLTAYLDGVNHFPALQVAMNAGVRLLSGRAIGIFDEPRAPYRLTADSLISRAA